MIETNKKLAKSYAIGSISYACMVSLLVYLVCGFTNISSQDVVEFPVMVGALFNIVSGIVIALIWRWVATEHQDMLVSFFTAVSGFRMLAALAVLTICFFVVGRDAMTPYVIVFMIYYLAELAHHSIFFSRINNKNNK